MDFIRIRHDDVDGTGMCTAEAFDLIYEEKGWQRVDDTAPAGEPETPAPAWPPAAPTPTPVNLLES